MNYWISVVFLLTIRKYVQECEQLNWFWWWLLSSLVHSQICEICWAIYRSPGSDARWWALSQLESWLAVSFVYWCYWNRNRLLSWSVSLPQVLCKHCGPGLISTSLTLSVIMGMHLEKTSFVITELTVYCFRRHMHCQPSDVGCRPTEGILCYWFIQESSGHNMLKVRRFDSRWINAQSAHV